VDGLRRAPRKCKPPIALAAASYLFLVARLREVFRDDLRDPFRAGTFPPFSLASLKPMAIACLRLLTLRPDPLFSVPFFLRRIADSTFFDADLPYFAMHTSGAFSCKAHADC
jgi:hypothetical protein